MLIFYLVIAMVTTLLGAGIAFISRAQQRYFGIIFGFTAGAVLSIVLMLMIHLYTEVGYTTVLVMWGGFLLILALEYFTARRGASPTGHAHGKDTSRKQTLWGVNLALLGLSIHSLADGFNLAIAAKKETFGGVLAFGILLHRLPIATFITVALLRDYGFLKALGRLTPLIVGPLFGALLGEHLLRGTFREFIEYLTAFAVGTLLHVMMDGFKERYTTESEGFSNAAKVVFIIGFILTFCAIYFFEGFEFEHLH